MYKLITMHKAGTGEKDAGENVHMVLKRTGKGRDKRGDMWDKWEVLEQFSTNDYDKTWLAKEAAYRAYRRLKGTTK